MSFSIEKKFVVFIGLNGKLSQPSKYIFTKDLTFSVIYVENNLKEEVTTAMKNNLELKETKFKLIKMKTLMEH
jgi:hypothetical protein